jgi:TolA-binding protein
MQRTLKMGAAVILTAASFASHAQELDTDGLRQSQAELLLQIEQLRQETQQLRGLLEELSFQMSEMSSDQKDRYLDLDERLGELIRVQKERPTASTAEPQRDDESSSGGAMANQPVEPEISDQEAYEAAFQLIRERQFEDALVAMQSFTRTYPDSELVLDAKFWRGQVFDVLGRDIEAIEEFKALTLMAPDYRRILQVKVKLGKLLIKNQQLVDGQKILEEVIAEAPESVEADLAQRELENAN